MNGNFEVNRHLAQERVSARLRDAAVHRQAKEAQADQRGSALRQHIGAFFAQVVSFVTERIMRARSVKKTPLPKHKLQ